MRGLTYAILLLVIASHCQGEVGQVCTSRDQCATDECCQIINIVVGRRRRQLLQPTLPLSQSGTCQKFGRRGEYCKLADILNGYCGCAPGLTCQSSPQVTPTTTTTLAPCGGPPAAATNSMCMEP